MNYYWLSSKDQCTNSWVMFEETRSGLRLLEQYLPFRCNACGKVDELKALAACGLDRPVTITSKVDFTRTEDGFLCFSPRLVSQVLENAIDGFEFEYINNKTHALAFPKQLTPVDQGEIERRTITELNLSTFGKVAPDHPDYHTTVESRIDKCGMDFRCPCDNCGRFRETLYFPMLSSIRLPESTNCCLWPDVAFENVYGRLWWLLASEQVVSLFKRLRVKGIDYAVAR